MRVLSALLFILLVSSQCLQLSNDVGSFVSKERLIRDIRELASDKCMGRKAGTVGEKVAGEYIEREIRRIGLKALELNGVEEYRHKINLVKSVKVKVNINGKEVVFGGLLGEGSKIANASGKLVFAGFGITVEGHDDYKGEMLNGSIVVILRGTPSEKIKEEYRYFGYKTVNALEHGASAVIIVSDPLRNYMNYPISMNLLSDRYPRVRDIVSLSISTLDCEKLFYMLKMNLTELQERIETKGAIGVIDLGVKCEIKVETIEIINYVGVIKGEKDEYVLISAHYDHLGLDPNGRIFYGADDDASGVACILEVARAIVESNVGLERSVIVSFWSANEEGLVGSRKFVEMISEQELIGKIVAVINIDMVGAGKSNEFMVFRVEGDTASKALANIIVEKGRRRNIEVSIKKSAGFDHYPFSLVGIPAVTLTSGSSLEEHVNHHTVWDTVENCSIDTVYNACILTLDVVLEISEKGITGGFKINYWFLAALILGVIILMIVGGRVCGRKFS